VNPWAVCHAALGKKGRRDPGNPDDQLPLPFGGLVKDVLGRSRPKGKVWPDGSYNCPFCFAAVPGGETCPNPACFANPRYPVARAREELALAEAREREKEARAKHQEWQNRYYEEQRQERAKREQEILSEARERGACIRCLDVKSALYGRKPKFVKHRGTCPKERGRDPEVYVPRGGIYGRDFPAFVTEVRALLYARGLPKSAVVAMVERARAIVYDAWRTGKAPCSVADRLYAGAARMRDPGRTRDCGGWDPRVKTGWGKCDPKTIPRAARKWLKKIRPKQKKRRKVTRKIRRTR
jgi:hypothetical protein